jgi:hypothetical protein
VTIENGAISGHTSTGIQVGEPGQTNLDGPTVNVTNVDISGAEHDAGHGDVANVTPDPMTVTLTSGGQTIVTSPTSTGPIVFNGSDGNDTITGHGELDTVVYTQTLSASDFSYNALSNVWTVTAGAGGTDHLTGVEKVTDGLSDHFLLVDPAGSYTTIQAAIDAASDGDTILVGPGTYSGFVNVNKSVTIDGANFGVSGTGGGRGAESVLTGGVRISVAGVTIDGVKIAGTYPSSSQDTTDVDNGLVVTADNATIRNSIFDGTGLGDVRPFSVFGTVTGLDFNSNQVENWEEGAYIVNGAAGTISGSDFHDNGNDILTESTGVVISNNSFENSVGSHIAALPFAQNVDLSTYILGNNTFSNDHPRPISVYPNDQNNEAVTVTGTDFGDTFKARDNNGDHGLSNGPFVLSGGGGNDVYYVNSTDTVIEQPNQGTDEVRTTDSFTLPANVDNLTLLDGATDTQTFDNMPVGPITNGENGWEVLTPGDRRSRRRQSCFPHVERSGQHRLRRPLFAGTRCGRRGARHRCGV